MTRFDAEFQQLVADMFASMYAAEGVGLAANQIGVDARVFVVDCPDATGQHVIAHVVNPVLHLPDPPQDGMVGDEGCLSIPGQFAEVERASTASVTGLDAKGEPVTIEGTGLLARCLQHETDHLDGLLYVNRLSEHERREILSAAELTG